MERENTQKKCYEGIGMASAPIAHTIAIDAIKKQLEKNVYLYGRRGLHIVRESSVDIRNLKDLIPDIVVFDKEGVPLVLFEITRHEQLGTEKEKAKLYRDRFPKAEVFIFEYMKEENGTLEICQKWHKLVGNKFEEGNNYCRRFDTYIEISNEDIKEMKECLNLFLKK